MNTIYDYLKQGPLMVGEVRGCKAETFKKFDKTDKNAPPIICGVLKVHLELLGDGAPVMVSIYPSGDITAENMIAQLGLERGVIVAMNVGKIEYKDGQRKVVCPFHGVHILGQDETNKFLAA